MVNEGPTVLLIEDNEDDLTLATLALAQSGWPHVLRTMRDGAEVITDLYDGAAKAPPAVVLLDLKLPKVDGKTVLRELRGNPRTTRVPVVVMTSSRLEQDVVDAYTLGANSYVQKPVDFVQFRTSAAVMIGYWLGLNVPPPGLYHLPPHPELLRSATMTNALDRTPRRGGDLEIVIVDGNERDRNATKQAIGSSTVHNPVRTLGSFAEVVAFLRPVGGPPPLLEPNFPRLFFVDVDLADGDGRDVLQALRYRADHHTVVVMFTRNRDPAFISECYRMKVSSIVFKPDDEREYSVAVRFIAHYWIHLNEPPTDPAWSVRAIAHPG
jgi:two-component system response regulator